ncbi:MAG: helix-turn-helix domain-containing protein [Nanoarchaeota archaeon]|nr:helix-turn-helix domain-containing protein [Nanoarchaeota archaeon]
MIVQKEFLNKLKDFGLNSYESKLWIALLSRGVSTAGELSDISNVPRSRSYDVLESLEKKGFIIMKVGKPIKYLAVPPAEVVERVKIKVLEEAEQQNTMLSKLKESETLGELNTLHREGIKLVDPTDKSGAFRGRDKVHEHLLTLVKNAKKNISIMVSRMGAERKFDLLASYLKKAKSRGVDVRVALPSTTKADTVDNFSQVAKIKQYKGQGARFAVIDDVHLVLFITDDMDVHKNYDCAIWVEAPYFVKYFSELFEKEWKN